VAGWCAAGRCSVSLRQDYSHRSVRVPYPRRNPYVGLVTVLTRFPSQRSSGSGRQVPGSLIDPLLPIHCRCALNFELKREATKLPEGAVGAHSFQSCFQGHIQASNTADPHIGPARGVGKQDLCVNRVRTDRTLAPANALVFAKTVNVDDVSLRVTLLGTTRRQHRI